MAKGIKRFFPVSRALVKRPRMHVARYVRQGVGHAVTRIARGYLRNRIGAIPAAALEAGGRYVYRKYMNSGSQTPRQRKKNRGTSTSTGVGAGRYITNGKYAGKVRTNRKYVRNPMDSFNRNGTVITTESIGNVTDNNCVYLMAESVNSRDAIFMLLTAMMRKLLEKCQIRVNGIDDPLFERVAGVSTVGYTVRLFKQNPVSGAMVYIDHLITSLDTFGVLCEAFRNDFEVYCSGFGELDNSNMQELYKFVVFTGTGSEVPYQVHAEMLFNETFIDLYCKCSIKVQNRTKSSTGSEDAENITNNPLQGRIYTFKGVPKPKANGFVNGGSNPGMYAFERMPYNKAVSGFGGTGAGLDASLKEPPHPKLFWNCYKAGALRLEPGEIKSFNQVARKTGNILKMLKSIRLQLDAAGAFSTYSIFPVQMIAMEDVINANDEQTISIQYEVQRELGVKCYSKQKKYYKTQYAFVT